MAQLSPEDRVFVNETFLSSVHGQLSCTACHNGNPNTDITKESKDLAHSASSGFIAHPSQDAEKYCGTCHSNITSNFATSLHYTQQGYFERFKIRAGGADLRTDPNMKAGFDKDCGKCHGTCGECHVIRPLSVQSGFISGHNFNRTPDMTNNCTACHGSRIGEEFKGAHGGEAGWPSGMRADIHYNRGMRCESCHDSHEMHGNGTQYTYRYIEGSNLVPKCEDCHSYVSTSESSEDYNAYHERHSVGAGSKLACQVCHSQPYKNCNGCHVDGVGITGKSYPSFKIGKNFIKSADRDYDYAVVRHIPIVPDTYDNWDGGISLSTFTSEPTWKYATPHNIQRWTSQTDTTGGVSCGASCHQNDDLFLKATDVDSTWLDEELEANAPVFME